MFALNLYGNKSVHGTRDHDLYFPSELAARDFVDLYFSALQVHVKVERNSNGISHIYKKHNNGAFSYVATIFDLKGYEKPLSICAQLYTVLNTARIHRRNDIRFGHIYPRK